jgi:DNA invertase Pin-like site-specific DNA recombinase
MRAALYLRISTRDGRQDADNQRAQLRRLCESEGWTIVLEFEDHESGGKAERRQFLAMMAAAAGKQFDVLVFWSLDRFSRQGALETLQHLNTLSDHGVGFRSLAEPYLDSCGMFKEAIISILATLAKQESLRMSERIRAGLDRVKATGTTSTGNPHGRPRAVFRRDLVAELRAQGLSWERIARKLNTSPSVVRRAFLSQEDALPKTTPAHPVICAGNESTSEDAGAIA